MKIIDINERHFNALTEYILPDNIPSNECQLYCYDHSQEKLLLKKYDLTDDDKYIGNKLLTISLLHHYKDQIDIPELIIPKYLVSIDRKVTGCLTPFIQNNTNLSILLQSKDISIATKKQLLKEVLRIVKKVQEVKIPRGFYLGDLHEANFIFNWDDSKIYVVDMDGCKIGNNEVYTMKYITGNNNIYLNSKYPVDGYNGRHIVSYHTEWYSFAMMVLNTIGGEKTWQLKENDFYDYLILLRNNHFSDELISFFYGLYFPIRHSEMTDDLIDQIPNDLSNVALQDFVREKNIKYIYLPK